MNKNFDAVLQKIKLLASRLFTVYVVAQTTEWWAFVVLHHAEVKKKVFFFHASYK